MLIWPVAQERLLSEDILTSHAVSWAVWYECSQPLVSAFMPVHKVSFYFKSCLSLPPDHHPTHLTWSHLLSCSSFLPINAEYIRQSPFTCFPQQIVWCLQLCCLAFGCSSSAWTLPVSWTSLLLPAPLFGFVCQLDWLPSTLTHACLGSKLNLIYCLSQCRAFGFTSASFFRNLTESVPLLTRCWLCVVLFASEFSCSRVVQVFYGGWRSL